jgi:UDP-N-acetylglucosamine transferase subunit ALG13
LTAAADGPLLLVTVGTDHHPFDRLVGWADAWLAANPGRLRCLMQTGTSAPPTGPADWRAYLEYDRHMGAVPIVVPRQHRLGEHVDDHQVAFSRRLAATGGDIHLAETEAGLHRLLDRVAAEPAAFRAGAGDRATAAAVRAFGRLVDGLVAERPTPRAGAR